MVRALIGLALVSAIAAGCSHPVPTSTATTTVAVAAEYASEVHGPDGGVSKQRGSEMTVSAGSNSLEIKNGRLTVNKNSYGTLKTGDSILVDKDGQVYVNGEKRSPQ